MHTVNSHRFIFHASLSVMECSALKLAVVNIHSVMENFIGSCPIEDR